jgi:glutamate racemase
MEPAIKPAALNSKTGVVGVLATRGTFNGRLYRDTLAKVDKSVKVIECIADEFVDLVERGIVSGDKAERTVRKYIEPLIEANADRIVLGCTHFPHLKTLITRVAAGRAEVVDSSEAVARQAERRLRERGGLNPSTQPGRMEFLVPRP